MFLINSECLRISVKKMLRNLNDWKFTDYTFTLLKLNRIEFLLYIWDSIFRKPFKIIAYTLLTSTLNYKKDNYSPLNYSISYGSKAAKRPNSYWSVFKRR